MKSTLKVGMLTGGLLLISSQVFAFNPATLNAPPNCNICITTFARNFPFDPGGAGPFGIAFLPDGKVLVTDSHAIPISKLYLFPSASDSSTTPPNCPSGPAGFNAPSFEVGFNRGVLSDDGDIDLAVSFDGRVFSTGTRAAGGGVLVELTYDSGANAYTASAPLDSAGSFAAGLALDHVSGFLFYDISGSQIRVFNPATNSASTIFSGAFVQMDGIDTSADGQFLWVADVGAGTVTQFTIVRNGAMEPTGLTSPTVLCTGLPGADGIAKGLTGTCLENFVFCNTNGGTIVQRDLVNNTCSNFLSGGSRGDFVKVGCNGWLYATQTDSIALIREASGGPLFECSNGPVPQNPTPTSTPTITPTPTATATNTRTLVPTSTLTATFTATPVVTVAVTSVATETPVVTVAATSTATHVVNVTSTATPTRTQDRRCHPVPHPNPCHDRVGFTVEGGPYDEIHCRIHTLNFREVCRQDIVCHGEEKTELQWDLRDIHGFQVGNGVYYAVIETSCHGVTNRYKEKVLVVR